MARISEGGKDLKQWYTFFSFSTSVEQECSLCKGQLAVPGHRSPQQSKHVIHTSCHHLDDQVEALHVGVMKVILHIEVTLRLIHTSLTFVTNFL